MRALLLCALLLTSFSGLAKLDLIRTSEGGKSVLYIKDGDGGIESGDAARIQNELSRNRYSQIWLHSGGGNLYEGVKIGLVLRRHSSFVRVKSGDHCISACTIAFLGGLLRTVDNGATYEVHSYSIVLRGLSGEEELQASQAPESFIGSFAETQYQQMAPYWSTGLLEYIRQMIQSPPSPSVSATFDSYSHKRFTAQLRSALVTNYQTYIAEQANTDVERTKREGLGAAHDIAMRLERDAMQAAIFYLTDLAEKGQLGERAKPALRILQTMFESSILSTASLNQSTLREYGYINVLSSP